MGKLSKFTYFCVTLLFFTFTNFYFSNLIIYKLIHGWEFSGPIFSLTYAENTGAAFSLMQNSTKFLMILSIIAILFIFYYVVKNLVKIKLNEIFLLSLLLAGIIGNLSERIFFGYVRDFFNLAFVNFPIFNISDVFINISVIGIIILVLFTRKNNKI